MKRFKILGLIGLFYLSAFSQAQILPPDKIYGQLFVDVQLQSVFQDSKTFVDCTPKGNAEDIVIKYRLLTKDSVSKIRLEQFVADNFTLPVNTSSDLKTGKPEPVVQHINRLWKVLERKPDVTIPGSSLLPLPYSYIVPGGRFREVYYWDSYFTMLGLRQSGEWGIIENMIRNFSFLIQTYGHIPNGNRTYYLSRSQPPYFCLMINLLAEKKGEGVYAEYLNSLLKEYEYWMDKTAPTKHVVLMPDGSILNRYYDQDSIPRQESYREDYKLATTESLKVDKQKQATIYSQFCRNLRSCAECGWDFSSRWFADGRNISTIQTVNLIPVDLNCLLYHLELTLAHAYKVAGNAVTFNLYLHKANARKAAINTYCWNEREKWYVDYDFARHKQSPELTIAGITPLFVNIVSQQQALQVEKTMKQKFLKRGGLVTTLKNTGQQWDAPNGWAPLQWIAIKGLENYNLKTTAGIIAHRWIKLNVDVYARTGKLMEKYNVENTNLEAGGGEYAGQDGFGWTNGVLLKLMSVYH
ncbi:MAG: alpha,alpha-trehalase TreF [Paludibacter sp.]|nr:alpha,alpha-trehalase TreF [Paludibacter sp.]